MHLVYKRPGPKYAVCSGSYKLSRYLLVKIITGFCSSSYHDYRVLLSHTHTHAIQAAFSLVSYRNKRDGFPLPAASMAAPTPLPSHHSPAGQPGPDPHRVGDTGVQNNNSEIFSHRLKKQWDFPCHPHLVKTVFPQVCSSAVTITLNLEHRRHMQTLISLEGCNVVFPAYENSVSSTVRYTTVALVFNTDPGLFWSLIN